MPRPIIGSRVGNSLGFGWWTDALCRAPGCSRVWCTHPEA